MAGQIIKRGEGRWLVRWYVGETNGKRRYESRTVHGTKAEASAELREVLRSLDRGDYVAPSRGTLDDFLDRWLESTARSVSGRTLANMKVILGKHVRPVIGHLQLQRINVMAIQEMIDGMEARAGRPLSPRTHQLARRYLSQALIQAINWKLLARNPTVGVKLPKRSAHEASTGQQRERRAFTGEQLRAFLTAARGTKWEALWRFLAETGARPGEPLALTWANLDFDRGTVHIKAALTEDEQGRLVVGPTKTKTFRTVPLSRGLVQALFEHRRKQATHALRLGPAYQRDADLVFATEAGGLLSVGNLRVRHFRPLMEAAGIDRRRGDGPYVFRHTVVSQLLLLGVAPQTVAERVGDKVETIMAHYAHSLPGYQERATEVMASLASGDA